MISLIARDRQIVDLIQSHPNLCFSIQSIGDLVIDSSIEKTRYTVGARRLLKLEKEGYIKCKRFKITEGIPNLYYSNTLTKQYEHNLIISRFLGKLQTQGFNVLDFKAEVPKTDYIRIDCVANVEYYGKKYTLLIEVDRSKRFNVKGYERLITEVRSGTVSFDFPLLVVSIATHRTESTDVIKPVNVDINELSIEPIKWILGGIKK